MSTCGCSHSDYHRTYLKPFSNMVIGIMNKSCPFQSSTYIGKAIFCSTKQSQSQNTPGISPPACHLSGNTNPSTSRHRITQWPTIPYLSFLTRHLKTLNFTHTSTCKLRTETSRDFLLSPFPQQASVVQAGLEPLLLLVAMMAVGTDWNTGMVSPMLI